MKNIHPLIKHLFQDNRTYLDFVEGGKSYSFERAKRRLVLSFRDNTLITADHHFNLQLKKLEEVKNICQLIKGIDLSHLLFEKDNFIFIDRGKVWEWQALCTYVPPLVLISIYLLKEKKFPFNKTYSDKRNWVEYAKKNFKDSCILRDDNARVNSVDTIHDLHVHLNGMSEADMVWQDGLKSPYLFASCLKKSLGNQLVEDLYEQNYFLNRQNTFLYSLEMCKLIRKIMIRIFRYSCKEDIEKLCTVNNIIQKFGLGYRSYFLLNKERKEYYNMSSNTLYCPKSKKDNYEFIEEIILIQHMIENRDSYIPLNLIHFYLLSYGMMNRFCVQQESQYGFGQFHKIHMTNARELSEKRYINRLKQTIFRATNDIHLEGRFSPKDVPKNMRLTRKILEDFSHLDKRGKLTGCNGRDNLSKINSGPKLKIKLVAHFIKRKDTENNKFPMVRHSSLRWDVYYKAASLVKLRSANKIFRGVFKGVDAAADELDAPPEVFAHSYRYLRQRGIKNFTYHAGEDFRHVMSGMRAIYEAVHFLDLGKGNRIGHATALGTEPGKWRDYYSKLSTLTVGEALDNFVFIYFYIAEHRIDNICSVLPYIRNEIEKYSIKVYGKCHNVEVLINAWLMRKYCPIFEENLIHIKKEEFGEESYKLYIKYLKDMGVKKKYNEIDKNGSLCKLPVEVDQEIQKSLLSQLYKKEIVIETLPTSNIRISFYKNIKEHHIWRWLKIKEDHGLVNVPPIVLGSDDPGIFANHIRNEISILYDCMIDDFNLSYSQAEEYIKQLCYNAELYKFD